MTQQKRIDDRDSPQTITLKTDNLHLKDKLLFKLTFIFSIYIFINSFIIKLYNINNNLL